MSATSMLTLFLALLCDVPPAVAHAPPPRLESRVPGAPPVWLRADQAIDAEGKLSPELGEEAIRRLQERTQIAASRKTATTATEPCGTYTTLGADRHGRPNETAEQLLSNAEHVFAGSVVGSAEGFYGDKPVRLLSVAISSDLSRDASLSETVYVVFPDARIVTKSAAYCSLPLQTNARPAIGDTLLVFSLMPAIDASGVAFVADPAAEMAVESASGLLLPKALKNDPRFANAGSISDVVSRLRFLQRELAFEPNREHLEN